MKKLLTVIFSFIYLFAKSEVTTASFFLVHETKIPQKLRQGNERNTK
jgi:cyclic lactone autoinducer peptide